MSLGSRVRIFTWGRIATGLYFSSLVALGWMILRVDIFPEIEALSFLILFTLVLGGITISFAFATGGLSFQIRPIKVTALGTILLGVTFIAILTILIRVVPPIPQSTIPLNQVIVPLLAMLGVHEEVFWGGLYVVFRVMFPGPKAFVANLGVSFFGGMAYHEFVAGQLFQGGVFEIPGYFLFIGVSWVFYRLLLEIFGDFGLSMAIHAGYNALAGTTIQ